MEAQLSMMMLPSGLFTENGTLQQVCGAQFRLSMHAWPSSGARVP